MSQTSIPRHSTSHYNFVTDEDTDACRHIPAELRALNQWVARDAQKMPINARTGAPASAIDPTTWSSYAVAAQASPDRLGFVLTEGDPYFLIDLDDVRDPKSGEIEPWVIELIERFDTFSEVSQSGRGIHLIGRGVKPGERCGPKPRECYGHGRYIGITGDVLDGRNTIRSCQRELTDFYRETWPEPAPSPHTQPAATTITIDERDLVDRLTRERDGVAARLLAGDTSGYRSTSEARWRLANKCCFYASDAEQITDVLLASGLFKDEDGERDRKRKAQNDATKAVAKYRGARYTPPATRAINTSVADPDVASMPDADLRAELQRERERRRVAEADRSMLIALFLNPNLKESEKVAAVASFDLALRKRPDTNDTILARPGEISNDWRPASKSGRNQPKLNADGSRFRMARGSVTSTMRSLVDRGLIDAQPQPHEVAPKNRDSWIETAWRIRRPVSLAAALAPLATYDPAHKEVGKPRALRCPECGEVHPTLVQTIKRITCTGCGTVTEHASAPKLVPPVVSIGPSDAPPDDLSDPSTATVIPSRPSAALPPSEDFSNVESVYTTSDNFSDPSAAIPPTPIFAPLDLADVDARLRAGGWAD